jgi:hypothetical protein
MQPESAVTTYLIRSGYAMDLDRLGGDLAVRKTMQPTHVVPWPRPTLATNRVG